MNKLDKEYNEKVKQIKSVLNHFIGTTAYFKLSPLFRNFLLTDGAKFVAEECQAYWLFELIASHQINPAIKKCRHLNGSIQCWKLVVDESTSKGIVTCEWDKGKTVLTQELPYTDFPLQEIKVWVSKTYIDSNCSELVTVAYLPSEY